MPVDELLFTTSVSLAGLMTGLERADAEARSRVERINNELGKVSFGFNTTEAISSLEKLTRSAADTVGAVRALRAVLDAPLVVNVDTSQLQRATAELRAFQAAAEQAMAQTARAAPGGAGTAPGFSMPVMPTGNLPAVIFGGSGGFGAPPIIIERATIAAGGAGGVPTVIEGGGGRRFGGPSSPFLIEGPGGPGLVPFSYDWTMGGPGGGRMGRSPFIQEGEIVGGGMGGGGAGPTMFMGKEVPNFGQAWAENVKPALSDLASMAGHSIFMAAAFGATYGTARLLHETFSGTVAKGMEFNQQMEQGEIALGSLLSLDRQYQTSSGQTASQLATYKATLSDAASVQEKLYDLDAKTLGTGQELVGVYQMILAFSRGASANTQDQAALEEKRLQFTTGFLNAAKIANLNEEQTKKEAQQIIELQRDQGQQVLHMAGVSIQQARAWKAEGLDKYFDEMNKRLAVFNLMGDEAGNTWLGLSTTFQTLSGRIAATTFSDTFSVTKEILAGINEEFRKMREQGEVVPALFGGDKEELRTFAANIAHDLKDIYGWTAAIANSFIQWGINLRQIPQDIRDAFSWIKSHVDTRGEFAGIPSLPEGSAASWFSSDPSLKSLQDRLLAEHVDQQTGNIATKIQQQQAIVGALTGVSTAGMKTPVFDAYLGSLDTAKEKVAALQIQSNALHATNVITDEEWKQQTATLKTLTDSIAKTKADLEKPTAGGEKTETDAVRNRRNAAIAAASSAEAAVEKKAVPFTGDIEGYMQAQEKAINDVRDKKIAAAKGDAASIDAYNREAAAKVETAWQNTSKLFVDFESKKQAAAERTANVEIRATEVETHGQTQLLDIQISGIQRQIHFAELRKEPVKTILDLYAQELLLIQHKSDVEIAGATKELDLINKKIVAERTVIADYDKEIAHLRTQPETEATKGRIAELDQAELKAKDDLNNSLTQQQKTEGEIAAAQEKALNTQIELQEKMRRENPTFQQAIQDRVKQSEYGANKEYADIAIDGIHNIGHALTDMINKGKFDWQSLGDVARDVLTRIENKLMDRMIDQGIDAILGKTTRQGGAQGSTSSGMLGGLFGGLFGGGSATTPATPTTTTAGTTSDAEFWNSVGLGDMAGSSSNPVSLASGGSGFMPTSPGGFGGPFGGMGGMNPMTMIMLASAMGGGKGGKGFNPSSLMSILPILMGGGMGGGMMGSLGGLGSMTSGAGSWLGGLFGGSGASAASALPGGFDANAINWGVAGPGTIPAGTGTGAGVASGQMASASGASMLGGALGAIGAGMSIASLQKDPKNIGSWLSLLMSMGSMAMMFMHDGAIVGLPRRHNGMAPDESLNILQSGEMVMSRDETAKLFSGGTARVPGGYRPDSRIFMANVSSGRAMSGGNGGGDTHVHNWHFHGVEEKGFKESQGQIAAKQSRMMSVHNRRYN